MEHESRSEQSIPSESGHSQPSQQEGREVGEFRRRARELAVAARTLSGGRRPWLERALRAAVATANRAANLAADPARPRVRGVARAAARRLDPTVVMAEKYAEALRLLVEAIHEEGGVTYDPAVAGYVVEAGTGMGKMTTGIAYSAGLSQALERATDLLRAEARTDDDIA
jgi:hypothetical protein